MIQFDLHLIEISRKFMTILERRGRYVNNETALSLGTQGALLWASQIAISETEDLFLSAEEIPQETRIK